MMSELMHQYAPEYLAVLLEALVSVNAYYAAVVYLDRLAEIITDIYAQYVKIVVLSVPVISKPSSRTIPPLSSRYSSDGKRLGYLVQDSTTFFVCHGSVQEILELLGTGGMTELSERLGLDLTDTLTGDVELLADLLKGAASAVLKTEAQAQDLLSLGVRVSRTSMSCSLSMV